MKMEVSATVMVAVLTAAASIFGVSYNQHGLLTHERQKWDQTMESERLKLEREAIADFAKTFATAFYLSENMIWRIEMLASSLTQKDFVEYAKESDAIKPRVATAEVMLAATTAVRHEKIQAALAEYRRVDENLIVTGRRIDANRTAALPQLNGEGAKLPAYRALVLGSLVDAARLQTAPK